MNIKTLYLISYVLYAILTIFPIWGNNNNSQGDEKKIFVPPKLFLKGSPYELGFQHGQCLKDAIAYNIKRLIDEKILVNQNHPQIKSFLLTLPQVLKYIPQDYIQELQGIADGAQIPYEKILLLNLFPEMFHCSAITVKGKATKEEALYHVRVLDYAIGTQLQDTAVLMVVQPEGKIPFLNVSYAGFIGSVTGMNSQHIAIGEIGGRGYGQYEGMPMAFLLRTILEQARNMQEIKDILASSPRTCEYYYIFSDGKTKDSLGVYATTQQLKFIEPGTSYGLFDPVNLPKTYSAIDKEADKIVLNPNQIETFLYQTLLYSDLQKKCLWGSIQQQPKDCLILTGFSYLKRYPILVKRIIELYGKIEAFDLQEIIKGEAGSLQNLHTAIFAPATLEVWIAHAGFKGEPAWSQPYAYFNLMDLFKESSFPKKSN